MVFPQVTFTEPNRPEYFLRWHHIFIHSEQSSCTITAGFCLCTALSRSRIKYNATWVTIYPITAKKNYHFCYLIIPTKTSFMHKDFNKFLEYLEPKVLAFGSVRLSAVIEDFWKIGGTTSAAIIDQVTGRLNATGKYVVQQGETFGGAQIRRNPNYEIMESIRKTNRVQRSALTLTVCVSLLTLVTTIVNMQYQSKRLDLERQQQSQPTMPATDTVAMVPRHHW